MHGEKGEGTAKQIGMMDGGKDGNRSKGKTSL